MTLRMKLLPLIALLLVATACNTPAVSPSSVEATSPQASSASLACAVDPGLETRTIGIITAEREIEIEVEMAFTPEQRALGLMNRELLGDECGMLFVFEEDADGGFWMKNTLIPLDIAYLDSSATVVSIKRMEPCEADPCPTYDPGQAYRYALEVNAGALEQWGIALGDQVELSP